MPLIDFLKEYAEALDDMKKEQQAIENKKKMMGSGKKYRMRRR